MVKSMIEQKMSLAAYATETGIVKLSSTKLDLTEKIIAALHQLKNSPSLFLLIVYLFPS